MQVMRLVLQKMVLGREVYTHYEPDVTKEKIIQRRQLMTGDVAWRKMKSFALLLLTLARHSILSATRLCWRNYHCMGFVETRYNGSKATCMVGGREWYLVG